MMGDRGQMLEDILLDHLVLVCDLASWHRNFIYLRSQSSINLSRLISKSSRIIFLINPLGKSLLL